MSETIIIALITLISAAVGAAAGAFGVIYSAKSNAETQLQQIIVQEVYKSRLEAYSQVLSTQAEAVVAPTVENIKAFQQAINCACIVASPKTTLALLEFQNGNKNGEMTKAVIAMQEDLSTFKTPKILKDSVLPEVSKNKDIE